ncbi:MAG: hypothetical protein ACOCXZ_02040 [Chloroflexota bacterium]
MNSVFVVLCSGLCLLVYMPVLLLAVRQIRTRQVEFSLGGLNNVRMLRFSGPAAVFFGIGQFLSAAISIGGILLALQETNLLYIPLGVIAGAFIAAGGLYVARQMQPGHYEVQVGSATFSVRDGGFVINNPVNQPGFTPDDVVIIEEEPTDYTDRRDHVITATDEAIIDVEYEEIDEDDPDTNDTSAATSDQDNDQPRP